MKKILTYLSCLLMLSGVVLAQENSSIPCGKSFNKSIAQGNTEALRLYIQECRHKPDKVLLQQYQVQTYTSLNATSLVCMGDYYAPRITHLSYLAYALAAKQKSLAAQVSLGVMLEETRFKKKLPLSDEQQNHYLSLAQQKHPYNYYETFLKERALNEKEMVKFKKKHHTNSLKYANLCLLSLENDLLIVKKEVQAFQHIIQRKRNHNTELWADTEFHFAQTKQHRLEKALKLFQAVALTK